jgi:hypothetical protein
MNADETPPPAPALASVRPPDFVLPRAEGPARQRPGELQVYVTWGGEIYGPATTDEVLAGIRSSWFEESAHFWFEGRGEWSPLSAFPGVLDELPARQTVARQTGIPQHALLPDEAETPAPPARKRRSQAAEHARPPKKPRTPPGGINGYLVVAAFILAAVGLTVGVLLLIWRFI